MTLPESITLYERQDCTQHGEEIQNDDFFWNQCWGSVLCFIIFDTQVMDCDVGRTDYGYEDDHNDAIHV